MGLYTTTEQSSTPATPASGFSVLYPKSDGLWYWKDDAGVEHAISTPDDNTYTPNWTAESGSAPVLGNGTLTGRYIKNGRLVFAQIFLLAGSTTTFGSGGVLRFDLPFTAEAAPAGAAAFSGSAYIDDTGTGWTFAFPVCRSTTFVDINLNSDGTIGTSRMTNTSPMTWTTGDSLIVTMNYISAT